MIKLIGISRKKFLKSTQSRKLSTSEAEGMAAVSSVFVKNRDAVNSISKKYSGKIDQMVTSTEFAQLPAGMKASMKRMYDFAKKVK
ncbi:MAG: hypothetical protein EOP09_10615 [Proteobacteria bacterium]|nr:MAG: hypothetical protein EOP09_10615 [Pseudomonadota bacterium]